MYGTRSQPSRDGCGDLSSAKTWRQILSHDGKLPQWDAVGVGALLDHQAALYSGSGVQPRENFFLFFQVQKYLSDAGLAVSRTRSSHYQWLLLPRVDPARLCTCEFKSGWARLLAKPFGRHFSFFGHKP